MDKLKIKIDAFHLLQAARLLLDDYSLWTQELYAKDLAGRSMRPYDPNVVCWCSVGALRAFDKLQEEAVAHQHLADAMVDGSTDESVTSFNDKDNTHMHHQLVLQRFDKAILSLGKEIARTTRDLPGARNRLTYKTAKAGC